MSLLVNHSLVKGGFHPYYIAVLNFATAAGYAVPTIDVQIKQNRLVVWLVSKGLWSLIDIIYILATDGDSNFATLNFKNAALFKCSIVNSPAFGLHGVTGNATTSYLDTGWIPLTHGVNFTNTDASFGGKINTGSTSQSWCEWGCNTTGSTSGSFFLGRFSGQIGYRINDGFTRQVTEASPIGLWTIDRNGSGAGSKTLYKNGASFNTSGDNAVSLPDVSFTICCQNNGGTKHNFSGRQVSVVYAGAKFTAQQHQDFYTGWNTYQTSL